ncbi:hypothetical protein B0H15DRAFT_820248 [Mycena belliarum]|uniref:Uncharacterized protein n=1 Tax=Mycena belliarum TaxID=1033014 RepID=A0AAD6UE25_9AGAR|nr:hypothetical protein B0H15DRAFT_820248 [Mycena belliae]
MAPCQPTISHLEVRTSGRAFYCFLLTFFLTESAHRINGHDDIAAQKRARTRCPQWRSPTRRRHRCARRLLQRRSARVPGVLRIGGVPPA